MIGSLGAPAVPSCAAQASSSGRRSGSLSLERARPSNGTGLSNVAARAQASVQRPQGAAGVLGSSASSSAALAGLAALGGTGANHIDREYGLEPARPRESAQGARESAHFPALPFSLASRYSGPSNGNLSQFF